MTTLDEIKAIQTKMRPDDIKATEALFEGVRALESEDFAAAHALNKDVRRIASGQVRSGINGGELERAYNLVKMTLLFDAPHEFDPFLQYVEFERDKASRFYLPRRKALKPIVDSLQDLADDALDLLAISLPPGVGKTTLAIFYLTWIGGKAPNSPILGGSHSNSLLRGVYDECLRIMKPDGEYLWGDVFPGVKIAKTNALDMKIDLDRPKRFSTFQFSSIESGNAGKVRAQSLLYCDDLCNGLEQALSKERLDNLWGKYTVDLKQRKIGHCKELHIATRWSVHDVLGRIEQNYIDNPRVRFIALPAVDENGNSNFDYGNDAGFDTAFFNDTKATMDDASWRALYLNQPIEREGLLYHTDDLRRFYELPEGEPDAIIGIADTAEGGGDDTFLPVGFLYGEDCYIEDCVCDNGLPEVTDNLCAEILLRLNVQQCQFESNAAGGRTADTVQEKVKAGGGRTRITKKRTTTNKATKIIVNSSYVKEHFLFKDKKCYTPQSPYGKMMNKLCSYTVLGKNKHDDVPDGMAQLSEYIQSMSGNVCTVFPRPF